MVNNHLSSEKKKDLNFKKFLKIFNIIYVYIYAQLINTLKSKIILRKKKI